MPFFYRIINTDLGKEDRRLCWSMRLRPITIPSASVTSVCDTAEALRPERFGIIADGHVKPPDYRHYCVLDGLPALRHAGVAVRQGARDMHLEDAV